MGSAHALLGLVFYFNLVQTVTTPARVYESFSNVLELTFVGDCLLNVQPNVEIVDGLSHHKVTVLKLPFGATLPYHSSCACI